MATDAEMDPIEILLVEPNPGDTRLFTEHFKDGKILNTIHDVPDGNAALDFVHQRGQYADANRPDIILLDPQLPGENGVELLAELKDDPGIEEIPLVVLTSSDVGEEIVQSHGLDADAYLRKPVEPEEFVEFVQSVEDFWLLVIQNSSRE